MNPKEFIRWYDHEDHSLFDVCADDHCQRYQGITRVTNPHVAEAVRQTRGLVLTFSDKKIKKADAGHQASLTVYQSMVCDTRFSKCCGGRTEEYQYCWENIRKDYLTSVECPYCKTNDKHMIRQVLNTYEVDNYTGFPTISGAELIMKFQEHVEAHNVEIRYEEVTDLETGSKEVAGLETGSEEMTGLYIVCFESYSAAASGIISLSVRASATA